MIVAVNETTVWDVIIWFELSYHANNENIYVKLKNK